MHSDAGTSRRPEGGGRHGAPRRILLVDPDPLTRWSVHTYLARWFDVASVGTPREADRVLDGPPVSVLIVSDDLPASAVEQVERRARARSRRVRLIRMITASRAHPADVTCIEKPFALCQLARLLGVDVPECRPSPSERTR